MAWQSAFLELNNELYVNMLNDGTFRDSSENYEFIARLSVIRTGDDYSVLQ